MSSWNLLFRNGAPVHLTSDSIPPVSTFLESHSGAYTTTRTHESASRLLFWERHVSRLSNSLKILFESKPEFLFGKAELNLSSLAESSVWIPVVRKVVEYSVDEAMRAALGRKEGEELSLTTLVSGNVGGLSELKGLDVEDGISRCFEVYVHVGVYVPAVFGCVGNCARLAMVGCGRDVAAAKYSDWARLRKPLMKMKPPSATELLLTNDGNHILEGCVTNFFVVCRKDLSEMQGTTFLNHRYEVQTAPICDGVLPGVIRQVVIEVCTVNAIPLREVAPSWSERESWEEAFVTNLLICKRPTLGWSSNSDNSLQIDITVQQKHKFSLSNPFRTSTPELNTLFGCSLRVVQHVEKIEVPCSWESLESQTWSEIAWDVKLFKDGPGIITALIQSSVPKHVHFFGILPSSYSFHVILSR